MSTSGIGRGRGWLNINKNQNNKPGLPEPQNVPCPAPIPTNYDYNNAVPVTGPKLNPKYTNILSKISLFDENDDGILFNQKLKHIIEVLTKDCQSAHELEESFQNIHENSLYDVEFASKAIAIFSTPTFHSLQIHGVKLRSLLVGQLQQNFDESKQLQISNPKMFRNTVKMLGDFYHKARYSDGEPIKFLSRPMLKYLDMLLESATDADLQLFTVQIFMNGKKIKELLPSNLAETLIQVRNVLVSNDRLSPTGKLWLTMAIDVSNNRYGLLPGDIHQFYLTQLGDDAMSHIKKLNTELSIQTSYQNITLDSVKSNVNVLQPANTSPRTMNHPKQNEEKQLPIEVAPKMANKPHNFGNSDASFNAIGTWEQPKAEKTPRPILGAGARLKHNDRSAEEASWKDGTRKTETEWEENNSAGWDSKKKGGGVNWNTGSINNKPRKSISKGWEHDDRLENDYN